MFTKRTLSAALITLVALAITPALAAGCGGSNAQTASYPGSPNPDIVDTAVAAGGFDTLVAAVQAAGLVDVLKGEGPFTVFAPTDEAFAKIPAETLKRLLADKEALTAVLTYHVVAGRVPASEVVKLDTAQTVQGSNVTIDTTSGVRVNNATVIQTDIDTSNGLIHVIDTVILPEGLNIS